MYINTYICIYMYIYTYIIYINVRAYLQLYMCAMTLSCVCHDSLICATPSYVQHCPLIWRGGGLGSRPKKMYGERLGDGVEYHLMKPTPRR